MKNQLRCAHCACLFSPNPRVKNQRYCNSKLCQRARKTLWQKQKLAQDPDYRQNQQDAKERWRQRNPSYWQDYRRRNPAYAERNRQLQMARDRRRMETPLAKMDASTPLLPIKSGSYYLLPEQSHLAKMDALAQKVLLISTG